MKPEQWIISVGMICGLVLVVAALTPDDFWEADVIDATSALADTPGAGAGIAGPAPGSQNMALGSGTPQAAAAPSWGRNVALKGLAPFKEARSQRFRGRIETVLVRGADVGWGQVHIWITGSPDSQRQISLAPDWYLKYLRCPIAENMLVKGAAFDFDTIRPGDKLYAKTITVNGKTCRLRNDEGFALWSNQLR